MNSSCLISLNLRIGSCGGCAKESFKTTISRLLENSKKIKVTSIKIYHPWMSFFIFDSNRHRDWIRKIVASVAPQCTERNKSFLNSISDLFSVIFGIIIDFVLDFPIKKKKNCFRCLCSDFWIPRWQFLLDSKIFWPIQIFLHNIPLTF